MSGKTTVADLVKNLHKKVKTLESEVKELREWRDQFMLEQTKFQEEYKASKGKSAMAPGGYHTYGGDLGKPAVFTGKQVNVQDIMSQNRNAFDAYDFKN